MTKEELRELMATVEPGEPETTIADLLEEMEKKKEEREDQ